jgi:predicted  nucleic acid-binding Zn-ribbon protein
MQKYNNAKAEYDDEQNRLNKQTSIYQRQDKMLDLKLKRLDTERNALNTEIDAVKKVIQDATDKGFKTFSG